MALRGGKKKLLKYNMSFCFTLTYGVRLVAGRSQQWRYVKQKKISMLPHKLTMLQVAAGAARALPHRDAPSMLTYADVC